MIACLAGMKGRRGKGDSETMILASISFISPSHFLFNDPSGDQEKERERERKRNGGCQTGRGNEKEGKETTDRSVGPFPWAHYISLLD